MKLKCFTIFQNEDILKIAVVNYKLEQNRWTGIINVL